MKKIFLFTLLMWSSLFIGAQIVYEQEDYFSIGDQQLYSTSPIGITDLDFSSTGLNFNWDFSSLEAAEQQIDDYINPEDAGFQLGWCLTNGYIFNCSTKFNETTNLAIIEDNSLDLGETTISNATRHLLLKENKLSETIFGITASFGELSLPFAFEYEKKDVIFQFPLQIENQDSSSSRLVLDLTPLSVDFIWSINKMRKNTVDGWGTLITPGGTFENTLRIQTIINQIDTIFTNGTEIPSSRQIVEYHWFSKDIAGPVFIASGTIIGGLEIINNTRYIDMQRCLSPNAFFTYNPLFPLIDSTSNEALVRFNNLSTNYDNAYWDFGDGSISSELNPNHTYTCGGLKNVRLVVENTTCESLASDTITLPLFIVDNINEDCDSTMVSVQPSFDMDDNTVNVFPNPFINEINIESLDGIKIQNISIMNLHLDKIYSQSLNALENTINLNLPGGVYFIILETKENKIIVRKLMRL